MKIKIIVPLVLLLFAAFALAESNGQMKSDTKGAQKMTQATKTDFQQIKFATITGDTTDLAAYKGKVIMLVNVASLCGHTPQYAGLEKLYTTYKDSGFVVIGFPANNFGQQEPGTNKEILNFCQSKYSVTFPMMAKISVKGDDEHPLYQYLTKDSGKPGDIAWNFTKFLLDRDGKVVARFEPGTEPDDPAVVTEIKSLL